MEIALKRGLYMRVKNMHGIPVPGVVIDLKPQSVCVKRWTELWYGDEYPMLCTQNCIKHARGN
jgi:hypothetical protein